MSSSHSEKCIEKEEAQIREARDKFGLASGSLGVSEIANDSTLVIIGFFTSLVSQRVILFVPEHRKIHVALLAIAATFFVFLLVRLVVDATATVLWRLSVDFASTVFRILKFICAISLVMTSHFLSDLLLAQLSGDLSWFEALCVLLESIGAVYFALQVFRISAS